MYVILIFQSIKERGNINIHWNYEEETAKSYELL